MTKNFYWLWPRTSSLRDDGTLQFKTSGFEQGDVRWTAREDFLVTDPDYPAMRWMYDNRNLLPPILERDKIRDEIYLETQVNVPPDGVYAFLCNELTEGWSETLKLPVTTLQFDDSTPSMQLLSKITKCNCFLFLHGRCEAAISVAAEANEESVTPQQAIVFLRPFRQKAD